MEGRRVHSASDNTCSGENWCRKPRLPPPPPAAFLYEGTAEIALQDLTDLTQYTEKRKRWESGVRFSVEQVCVCLSVCLFVCLFVAIKNCVDGHEDHLERVGN